MIYAHTYIYHTRNNFKKSIVRVVPTLKIYEAKLSKLRYIAKHFGEASGTNIIINHHFTQQDIATLVGIARETASNEMVKLEQKGFVRVINHEIIIENIDKLELELISNKNKSVA